MADSGFARDGLMRWCEGNGVDYVFGLAFVVWSAVLLRSGRAAWAGVLAGLAMGCRVGSVVLIVPMLFAQVTEPDDRPAAERWRPILVAGGVAAAATLLLMVPSYRASGGFDFVQNDFRTEAPLVHLGRAAVKNLAMFGIVASAVALLAIPPIVRSMRTWSTSWLLRFAVPGFVLSELLFVRFPWKVSHLLPALACGAIALAVALRDRPRLLVVLAALQLVSGVVTIQVFTPDRPNFAEGADVGFDVVAGQVVTDWRCRREYPDAYRGRQRIEVEEAWACSQPFVLEQDR